MIGLVDYTLQSTKSVKLAPPNLEIMKLATYYRTEENTFCRLIDLNDTELDGYDKIFFFSEDEKPVVVPPQFLRAKNVVFGGTAFTNGKYLPFQNEIIDFTIPRPTIYKEYLKQKYNDGIKAKVIEHLLDDSYYRFMAGENKLPFVPVHIKHRIFLYDMNLFQPGWEQMIQHFCEHRPSSIICIHPIVCHTLTQYFSVRNYPKIARTNDIILDLDIPMDEVNYMLKHYAPQFLADISTSSMVFLTLGNSFPSPNQYYSDFTYKINLLYAFWARNIPIKIKYIEPKIGFNDPLHTLSQEVSKWTCGKTFTTKTLGEYVIKKTKVTQGQLEYEKLMKARPDAADLFKQTFEMISQRRFWRL